MAGNNRLAFRIILGFALRRAARAVVELSAAIRTAITFKAIGQIEKRLNVLGLVTAYRVTASAPNVSKLPAFVVRDFIAPRAKRAGLSKGSRANVVKSIYFEQLRAIEYRSWVAWVAANIADQCRASRNATRVIEAPRSDVCKIKAALQIWKSI
jgi:hypothetical protein